MKDCLVIIPTYNEKENIEKIIRKVFSLSKSFDILIVDDNSPDGTAHIVKDLIDTFSERLYIIQRASKLGLGTAYIAGFKWALAHEYEFIFEMDADFSHNPDDLLLLLSACSEGDADLAIGSRYKNGVNVINWSISRILLSYYASVYVRLITGMSLRDTTSGFKCYTKKLLQAIDLTQFKLNGYGFQIEMKFIVWKMGSKIEEVPIVFTDRKLGHSKMVGGIFNEAFFGVIVLKLRSYFKKYPKL